ncbi:hypothetical protein N0V86_002422 [Didymella sp. IMI 355093]|nr:hypothetical protein N0V86_002422 [Didymella sp. IMI 355093]
MYLLQRVPNGEFILSEFHGKQIPDYAILSHTWIANDQEVTFKEITKGKGKDKLGYNKLKFCADQATKDGLRYFWVDTCCIDKRSSAELHEAINSMFMWYQESKKCYVYLSDVPSEKALEGPLKQTLALSSPVHQSRILAFEGCRWFRRGWTLQELLAPTSVEFFDSNGNWIGDKRTLQTEISEATRIPSGVLLGDYTYLLKVDEDERLSWAAERQTTREEDAAYSLLGLFDIHIALLYGEGRKKAFMRLHRERLSAKAYERLYGRTKDPFSANTHQLGRVSTARVLPSRKETLQTRKRLASEAFPPSVVNEVTIGYVGPNLTETQLVLTHENGLIPRVIHADVQVESVSDLDPENTLASQRIQDTQEDDAQVRDQRMQAWWDQAVAANLALQDGYDKVAVLLVKWADEIDELRTREEVRELFI